MTANPLTKRRWRPGFLPVAVSVLAAAAVLLSDNVAVLRALLVVPLLVWAPGWVVAGQLLPRSPIPAGSRLAAALGLSLSLSVVVSVVWNWLPGGITGRSVVWSIAALTLMACVLSWRLVRGGAGEPAEPPPGFRATPRLVLGVATSLILIGAAITLSALGEVNQPTPAFSELWVTKAGTDRLQIGLKNDEGHAADYRLVVLADGHETATIGAIHLDATATWHAVLSNPPGAARVTIELFRPGDASSYRTVVVWNSPSPSP